jgi:hypothetical protein
MNENQRARERRKAQSQPHLENWVFDSRDGCLTGKEARLHITIDPEQTEQQKYKSKKWPKNQSF